MDSEQDIAAELERLNTELQEIAAAEDITLSIGEDVINTKQSADTTNDASHQAATKRPDSSTAESKPPQASLKERLNRTLPQENLSKAAQTVAALSHQRSLHSNQLQSKTQAPLVADAGVASSAELPPAVAAHTLQVSEPPQHPQHSLQQGLLLQELLHQHGKLLDLLHILASNSSINKARCRQRDKHQQQLADTDADAGEDISSDLAPDARYIALQEQYQNQLSDNHQLNKRLSKVQKVLLQHLQDAQLRAAAAEAACDEAQRREQDARAAAAALQTQLVLQQQDLEQQQIEFTAVRDQLQQVRDLHKQKIAESRVELKQQYDAQLQATTAAYAQELAQIQAHLAGSKQRLVSKRARSSKAAAAAAAVKPDQQATVKGSSSTRRLATAPAAVRRPGQPGCTAARCSRSSTPASVASDRHELAASGVPEITSVPAAASSTSHSAFAFQQQQQQMHSNSSEELHVPAEVVQYAQQYQQGGEGSTRPPTAPPSVLQRRRQQEQPVPEAAAQLAQHFVAGGEGISRPLTAPSSDRLMSRHSGNSTARNSHSNRPSVRTIVEPLVPLHGVAQYSDDLDGCCGDGGVESV